MRAAFSPDGKFLASGSGGLERVIKIWNVADGTVVRDLANPTHQDRRRRSRRRRIPACVLQPALHEGRQVPHQRRRRPRQPGLPRRLGLASRQDALRRDAAPGRLLRPGLSPDEKLLALAAGNRGRPQPRSTPSICCGRRCWRSKRGVRGVTAARVFDSGRNDV